MSESRKNNEELTVSPQGVSHQELTTVAMDAASSEREGGGGRLETPGNRESPEEANGEEEEEDNEGGDDDEEEEEEEEEGEDDDDEEEEDEEEEESDQSKPKECVYKGCTETTSQVAKTRKPWMCKKHRNKTYKDKYKKKKKKESVQAMVNINKSDDDTDERPTKQRLSCMIVHQTSRKASLLEQVLNQKRLSLLRSPEVVQFLQQQQRLLSSQALAQRQQFQETPM